MSDCDAEAAAPDDWLDIARVLAVARSEVDTRSRRREAQGHHADEELQTHWLCDAAWPRIEYAQFNRIEEGVVGADWLWWFLDAGGECFGILIQAKKLRGRPGHRTIDLAYPDGTRGQMRRLFAAANHFDVPAGYILYCGDHRQRADLACVAHDPPTCPRSVRASVSVLSALAASTVLSLAIDHQRGQLAIDAYRRSVPLEDMVRPAPHPVFDLNLRVAGPDLREFLLQPQNGARGVAKRFFTVISEIRKGQFTARHVESLSRSGDAVFNELPADAGHFGLPYFDHVLRGLRRSLPDYVTRLIQPAAEPPPAGLDGIVVVHL